jgi:hypothetical protein
VILGVSRVTDEGTERVENNLLIEKFEISYFDFDTIQSYDSPEHMLSTYGSIFGSDVIHYIRENKISEVIWTNRVQYLIVN